MSNVTVSEFARLFELSQQRVSDMIGLGMPAGPPAKGRAGRQVNVRQAHEWLVQRAVDKVKTPDDGESAGAASLRKLRADADLAELKARQADGVLVELDRVEQAAERAAVTLATQLDGLAGRIAARVAAESDVAAVRSILFAETRRIRDAFSVELATMADSAPNLSGGSSAAGEDAGPMGGPVSDSSAGERGAGSVAQ